MQSVFVFLAVLFGASVAHPMVLSPDDIKDRNRDISSTEYLKIIFQQDSVNDALSPILGELVDIMNRLELVEARRIARMANLRDVFRDAAFDKITVCLPTDEAAKKWKRELPEQPDSQALQQLFKAWIIPGTIMAADVTNNLLVESNNGVKLRFNVYPDELERQMITVNGAKIIKADQKRTLIGGRVVVHVLDKVLYPLPTGDVIKTLSDNQAFSVMLDLLKRTDLITSLKTDEPVTVLVPTNAAFQALPQGTLDDLKNDAVKLEKVLKYHVITDVRYSASLSSGKNIIASQNDRISVNIENHGQVILNQEKIDSKATVIKADIPTTNGVIHIIDHVLIPPQKHFILV